MLKKLFITLFILPLFYAPWPPGGAAACHISGQDLTNFKNRNVSPLAPVPHDENNTVYEPIPLVVTAADAESQRRKSPLKKEMAALEGKTSEDKEKKVDSDNVDLTSLDAMTVVVPSASGGSR